MKNKFIEFITKYDILYIFIILIFAISGFILFYGNIYSPYSDIGREFYAAQQITNGNILYKDIFNVYICTIRVSNKCHSSVNVRK